MSSEKRVRTHEEMSKEMSGKDYAVCDQCRIKKIRCGREKPFCSNCNRLGQKCEWSGNGKKGNQTALLSHTIEGLSRRLENLEDALAETQNTVKRLASGTPTLTEAPVALQPSHTWPTPEDATPTTYDAPIFKRPLGHFMRGQNAETTERYFEPTSLESLLYSIRDSILEPLVVESGNQSVRENALVAQQKIDLLVSQEEKSIRNGILPTAPPISILRGMIEPYFSTINPHFPIWTKESFERIATALQTTCSSGQDLGRIVCSNNLILMTLAANLSHPPRHSDKSSRSKPVRGTSSIDLDLTKGFLANARRAIEHAELLLSPRLINVQALLSLCVVAQEHMPPDVFKKLFNMAAQCARSIGVHDWERNPLEREDTRERQCVSYCLYILDKTACWIVGGSVSIPVSDVYIDTTLKLFDDKAMNDLVSKTKLAEIEEEIYLEIYARRAPARTEDQVRMMISKFNKKLQDWLVESSKDQEADSTASLEPIPKIELSIGFACTQLLYMWPFKEHPDATSQRIEVSRRCMRLLLRLWDSTVEIGHQGILPRIVASHPPLYLYEVYAHVLSGDEGQDSPDVELLQSFAEMLRSITDLQEENTYNRRLCEISSVLIDVVSARKTQHKRRKTHHTSSPSILLSSSTSPRRTRRASPFTPSSDIHTHYNENNTSPQVQNDSQGTSNLTSSSFDSLISPADSGGCAEDQLATLIGSLGKGPFETFDLLEYNDTQTSRSENLAEKEIWWN
ncbi:fungal-specific transcription factor domain-containing protein [Annulohypoxylon maeteangense]|uniref:fungal-specific transcription factor domain-containing protein n=1 Tax=Annulohypoxylon maeteangense TaxID=1927788 RepID=UPI0020083158|nr:fungal-specific transcription factor domain-containing protein [Annulohypoxylon maeteangense]KAI0889326.1 fungal-specific transcription factor domain-containing protein [Annulohypoxylon maeteangense]